MSVVEIICGVIMLLVSIALIILVVVQEAPKQGGGMSALTGAESMGANRLKSFNELLVRGTRFAAIVFFAVTFIVYTVLSRGWFR